jgi:small subunit ribosomal protein S18
MIKKGKQGVKSCPFCMEQMVYIDYKDLVRLKNYITDRGKILNRFIIKSCNKHQHQLAAAIKRARYIGLLPYIIK